MPRSRSRSIESSSCARIARESTVWVSSRIRSASVDLPWSMWAMIEKLRIWAWSATPCRLEATVMAPAGVFTTVARSGPFALLVAHPRGDELRQQPEVGEGAAARDTHRQHAAED